MNSSEPERLAMELLCCRVFESNNECAGSFAYCCKAIPMYFRLNSAPSNPASLLVTFAGRCSLTIILQHQG